eukprot:CAMPEP_0205940566 /NCGR_PEP_ID=MMETSP1325-20131115/52656_1 /ASSEMBLY_ACC=CAM_ASM_000708 /TAXON_ID=236786 /ORGANISM="Florenciella sp., Strain RCC1007" /LENGTH=46 /DNA_ID= /DNA_START= /DNA_END= /DNA_ORIENTATION=
MDDMVFHPAVAGAPECAHDPLACSVYERFLAMAIATGFLSRRGTRH